MTEVNAGILSPGRQAAVQKIIAALAAGRIGTGAEP
jgi:hypothetical protein